MSSPALAIAWEFGQKLRLGLIALAIYWVGVGMTMLFRIKMGWSVSLSDGEDMALLVAGPVAMTFMYFLGVFTFGFASDLTARESMYPARMFALPVSTRALTAWPMLYGTAAMMALLLLSTSFVRWETKGILGRFVLEPWGFDVPGRPCWPRCF
jgi:hypothetical protein